MPPIACMFDTGNAVMVTGGSFGITTSLLQGQKTGAREGRRTARIAPVMEALFDFSAL